MQNGNTDLFELLVIDPKRTSIRFKALIDLQDNWLMEISIYGFNPLVRGSITKIDLTNDMSLYKKREIKQWLE